MGLEKGDKPNYVNLSDGKFYESEDKEKKNPYGALEGYIKGLTFKDDTYENQKVRKCVVTLYDGQNTYNLSLRVNSSYFGSFVSFLKNADLSQPVKLKPAMKTDKQTGKSSGSIFIEQNGVNMRHFYTKDNPNGLPPFKKTKISGNIVWDKTEYLEFLENVVEKEFKPLLGKNLSKPLGLVPAIKTAETFVDASEDVNEDLPF